MTKTLHGPLWHSNSNLLLNAQQTLPSRGRVELVCDLPDPTAAK